MVRIIFFSAALFFASILRWRFDLIELLIENGADVNAKSRNDDGMTPFHWACKECKLEAANFIIKHGANVNTSNNDGNTPLHDSCRIGHVELSKYLIDSGADVNARNIKGQTPLHLVSQYDYDDDRAEIIQLLHCHGADLAATTKRGSTPLEVACERNHRELVWLLVRQYYYPLLLIRGVEQRE